MGERFRLAMDNNKTDTGSSNFEGYFLHMLYVLLECKVYRKGTSIDNSKAD